MRELIYQVCYTTRDGEQKAYLVGGNLVAADRFACDLSDLLSTTVEVYGFEMDDGPGDADSAIAIGTLTYAHGHRDHSFGELQFPRPSNGG